MSHDQDTESDEPTLPDNEVIISKCEITKIEKDVFETFEEMREEEVIDYHDELWRLLKIKLETFCL